MKNEKTFEKLVQIFSHPHFLLSNLNQTTKQIYKVIKINNTDI
jgi:hypothetical protein